MANVLDCDIVVREFELQSCYYVHFRTNTLGKGEIFSRNETDDSTKMLYILGSETLSTSSHMKNRFPSSAFLILSLIFMQFVSFSFSFFSFFFPF